MQAPRKPGAQQGRSPSGDESWGAHSEAQPSGGVGLSQVRLPTRERVALLVQLGKLFALNAKTLVLGQMPMQNIQLHRGHSLQRSFENFHRMEMPCGIDHQPTPGKTRPVGDRNRREIESVPVSFQQLQQRFKTAHRANRRRSG